MEIEWRPVPGFEGVYEVSEYGDLKRVLGGPGRVVGRLLRPVPDKDGYLGTCLMHDKRKRYIRVHRLVCEAFHGPAPEGKPWALHGDGNPRNNHWSNLRWGDARENQMDAVAHGTHWEAKKTRCLRDHPLDDVNTYIDGKGKRSCKVCRVDATTAYMDRAKRAGLPPGDARHGTSTGYGNYGCRCEPCREARKRYKKEWRARRGKSLGT